MLRRLIDCVEEFDHRVASLAGSVRRDHVLSFAFHSILDGDEDDGSTLPQEGATSDHIERLIRTLQEEGYGFVSPGDILSGTLEVGRHVALTLDDGYANSQRILPIVRKYDVPATVFVTSSNVETGRAFWWDVLYRERRRQGQAGRIRGDLKSLKQLRFSEIESFLSEAFGAGAWDPWGESDRPLNRDELRQLAMEPLITIGNHTANHAILTRYSEQEIAREIEECQTSLANIVGSRPKCIAYPNGNYNAMVANVARDVGLRLGFAMEPRILPLTMRDNGLMSVGRYLLSCDESFDRRVAVAQQALQMSNLARTSFLRVDLR